MRNQFALAVAVGSGAFLTVRVDAATIRVNGYIDLHAGYGSNPFFDLAKPGPSPLAGTTASATISRVTAVSSTQLTGQADIDHYVSHYGTEQNYSATLRHNQQLSHALAVTGYGSYENAINPGPSYSTKSADLQPQSDLLTVGQRTRRFSGGLDLTWEPNNNNLFQAGLNGSHSSFAGGAANGYTQYGGSLGYLRTLNSHTKLGIQGGVVFIDSVGNPRSKSYTAGLQWIQQINAAWKFEGGASLLAQSIQGSLFKSFGFNGTLCGTYPRFTICFFGSRTSAASGLGGLRTDTQAGERIDYKMTPRSRLALSVTYDLSTSPNSYLSAADTLADKSQGLVPAQKYYDAAIEYRHDISRRLEAGVSGRAQKRDYGTLFSTGHTLTDTSVTAYSATVNLVWKFGRST